MMRPAESPPAETAGEQPEMASEPAPESPPANPPANDAAMAQRVAAAEAVLERAQQAVVQNRWDQMGPAAEEALAAAADDAQRQRAEVLDRLVRYALEYRRAIRDGGRSIGAGDSFEMQFNGETIRAGMVENN